MDDFEEHATPYTYTEDYRVSGALAGIQGGMSHDVYILIQYLLWQNLKLVESITELQEKLNVQT